MLYCWSRCSTWLNTPISANTWHYIGTDLEGWSRLTVAAGGMPKVTKNDREGENGGRSKSPGWWSVFCHLERCLLFLSTGSPPLSSPPHLLDRYSASTKVLEKAYENVSQSTLTELKATEFEISQAAVCVLSPSLRLFRLCVAWDAECT